MSKLDKCLLLPDELIRRVKSQGETGMGYSIATIRLKGGTVFPQAVIVLPY